MRKKNNSETLKAAIQIVQEKQLLEINMLKIQFQKTYESIRPINLIKNTISDVATSPDFGKGLVNSAIGLATGYFSKKFLLGATHNPIKKILGIIVEFGIANFVTKKVNDLTTQEPTENLKINN